MKKVNNIILSFVEAFTKNDKEYAMINLDEFTLYGLKKIRRVTDNALNRDTTIVIFPWLNSTKSISTIVNQYSTILDIYMEENNIDAISFEGLKESDIKHIDNINEWGYNAVLNFYLTCPINYKSNAKCNIRRAVNRGVICEEATELEDFYDIRKCVDYLNLGVKDSTNQFKRQVEFFYERHVNGDGLGVLAKYDNNIVGGMLGIIFEKTAYMVIHGYNPAYNSLYCNDLLYHTFVTAANDKGIDKICWGNAKINDTGLVRMKKKFSNNIENEYFLYRYNRTIYNF